MSDNVTPAQIVEFVTTIIDAAGTGGGTHLQLEAKTQKEKDLAEAIQQAGTIGDLTGVVSEQAFEAYKYVQATKKPSAEGLQDWLTKSKLKVSWASFKFALKYSNQFGELKGASKCMADTAETVLDLSEFTVAATEAAATGGVLIPLAVVKGISFLAQLYATAVSCRDAVVSGLSDISALSREQIQHLSRIQGRLINGFNRFVSQGFERAANQLNPDRFDYSVLPKSAQTELAGGLFTSLRNAGRQAAPAFVQFAIVTKLSKDEALKVANGIMIANKNGNYEIGKLQSPSDRADVERLVREFEGMSLGGAFCRVVEMLRLSHRS